MGLVLGFLGMLAVVGAIALGAQSCDSDDDDGASAPPAPSVVDGIWEGSFDRPVDGPRVFAPGAVIPVANANVFALPGLMVTSVTPSMTDPDSVTVHFQMSLASSSNNIVTGTYSDQTNKDGNVDGNYLAPNLTTFARAIEGQYHFVGPVDDAVSPIEWDGTMTATTSGGEDLFIAAFAATKSVDWSDYAGDYDLVCTSRSAPGGFNDFTENFTYTWTVATNGDLRVETNNEADRFPSAGSVVIFGDLSEQFPELITESLNGIVYLKPTTDFDPDNPAYDEIFGIARREDGTTVAAITNDRTTEEYLFDDRVE